MLSLVLIIERMKGDTNRNWLNFAHFWKFYETEGCVLQIIICNHDGSKVHTHNFCSHTICELERNGILKGNYLRSKAFYINFNNIPEFIKMFLLIYFSLGKSNSESIHCCLFKVLNTNYFVNHFSIALVYEIAF